MSDFGLQLRQFAQALRSHGLDVVTWVVNYARKALGRQGDGHIALLGACYETGASSLVLDVTPDRAPWV